MTPLDSLTATDEPNHVPDLEIGGESSASSCQIHVSNEEEEEEGHGTSLERLLRAIGG
jgi:hypothetical protein